MLIGQEVEDLRTIRSGNRRIDNDFQISSSGEWWKLKPGWGGVREEGGSGIEDNWVWRLKEFQSKRKQANESKYLEGEADSNEDFYADDNDLEERENLLIREERKEC